MPAPALSPSQASLVLVESARYALLRRLAFAMRHQMVVYLQPIGLVSELMDRRLRVPQPDPAQVHEAMGKLQGLSKQAVQSCLDVITWMAPEPAATVTADAAVREIADLLRSHFSFRGFHLDAEPPPLPQRVHKAGARMLVAGCLLALTDAAQAPATVAVTLAAAEDEVTVDMRVARREGTAELGGDAPYRLLQWHEMEAIANAESVVLERGEGWVRFALPALLSAA